MSLKPDAAQKGPQNQTPMPQLSLCIPHISEIARIPEFIADVTSFFAKFPIQYEVLLAAPRSKTFPALSAMPPNFHRVPVQSAKAKAQNLALLFAEARGEFLIATELDLSIPLSECFKILQEFFANDEVQAVFGDRTQKKKKLENTTYSTRLTGIETFFKGIIHDKTSWKFQDPFCPVFALRKTAFTSMQSELCARGWHLTPEVQLSALKGNLVTQEIPLYAGSRSHEKAPVVREILGLLNFVLFRI